MTTISVSNFVNDVIECYRVFSELSEQKKLVKRDRSPESMSIHDYETISFKKEENYLQMQIEEEDNLLPELKTCRQVNDNVIKLFRSLSQSNLRKYLVSHVADQNSLIAFKCIVEEIFDGNREDGNLYRNKIEEILGEKELSSFDDRMRSMITTFVEKSIDFEYTNINRINETMIAFLERNLTSKQEIYIKRLFACILALKNAETETSRMKIKSFLGNMKRIGEPSANGIAIMSDVGDIEKSKNGLQDREHLGLVIIKVPRKSTSSDELVHETIIGETLLNLRDKVPYFATVFGTYFQGVPIENTKGQIIQQSVEGETVAPHTLYEPVNGAKSIAKCKNRNHLLVMLAMRFSGLKIANDELDFTHYDLHEENDLLYSLDENESEPFIGHEIKGFPKYWLKCVENTFPMTIDYGMSHIKLNGNHYGVINHKGWFASLSIYRDQSNYVSDPFKLICMIARTLKGKLLDDESRKKLSEVEKREEKSNLRKCLNLCKRLLGYFFAVPQYTEEDRSKPENDEAYGISDEELSIILNNLWEDRYHIPIQIVNMYGWSMEGLLEYCLNIVKLTVPDAYSEIEPDNILGKENSTKSVQQTFRNFGISKLSVVSARDLYISRGSAEYDELYRIFMSNTTECLHEDEANIVDFLSYNPNFISIDVNRNRNRITNRILKEYEDNILLLSAFVSKMSEFKGRLKMIRFAKEHSSVYENLYNTVNSKYVELFEKFHSYDQSVTLSYINLKNMIFGNNDKEIDSHQLEQADKLEKDISPKLVPLFRKYFEVYNSYKQVSSL